MKYFNKSFFKSAIGFLIIVALSLLLIVAVSAYANSVEKIVFTTDVQTIKPNAISDAIKVQFQDSGGNPISFGQTAKMVFESSSPTGNFVSESGNPVSSTINSNWTSRTFYYQDSSEGNFVLTISIEDTDLSTSQNISVSASGSVDSSSSADSSSSSSSNASAQLGSSSSGSSVAGPNLGVSPQLDVTAGSDRLTAPGSPITFQAQIKKNSVLNQSLVLNWSFGDGNVGVGSLVTHTYKYPGEYAVVLNARAGQTFAVSRIKVKVVEPNLNIREGEGFIEITNEGNSEINLYNWRISSAGKGFVFQPDTIVLPKGKIRLDNSLLKMKGIVEKQTILKNAINGEVVVLPEKPQQVDYQNLSLQIDNLLQETVAIIDKATALGLVQEVVPKSSLALVNGATSNVATSSSNMVSELQPASEIGIATIESEILYESSKEEGVFGRTWRFLKAVVD